MMIDFPHMNECCKKFRSNYCPECGGKISASSLSALLRHCKVSLDRSKGHLEDLRRWEKEGHGSDHLIRSAIRTVDKWQSWYDALAPIVSKENSS